MFNKNNTVKRPEGTIIYKKWICLSYNPKNIS